MNLELKRLTTKGQRYSIFPGAMGCAGDPLYYPTYEYHISSGNYLHASITSILESHQMPEGAEKKLLDFLREKGYTKYIEEMESK